MISSMLSHCSALTSLTIHCLSDDAIAAIAAGCPLLRRFEINHDAICDCTCAITDVGVTHLARQCPQLRSLSLGGFPAAGSPPSQALALLQFGCMER